MNKHAVEGNGEGELQWETGKFDAGHHSVSYKDASA
jgi:hypothetical protein